MNCRRILVLVFAFLFFQSSLLAKEKLVVFHAGSLTSLMRDLTNEFSKKYPDLEITTEASGSRAAARKVSELGRKADLLALADYLVIEDLLMPEHAKWYIKFSRNRMVIAFTDRSKYKDEINRDNWYKILAREGVKFGHSDPDLDPAGYRSLMVWQLADLHYKDTIGASSIYDTLDERCPPNNIRPGSVQLLPLLETLALDYAFEYLSFTKQHNLRCLILPEEIDLSNPDLDNWYKKAKVLVSGKSLGKYSSVFGSSIAYALTVPENSPNYHKALEFVRFILSKQGRAITKANFHPLIFPALSNDRELIPQELIEYVR